MKNIASVRLTFGIDHDQDGNPLPEGVAFDFMVAARKLLAETYGGYTETSGSGGWFDPERKVLVEENVVIYEVVQTTQITQVNDNQDPFDRPTKVADFTAIPAIVERLGRLLNQSCVLVQYLTGESRLVSCS